MVPLDTARLEMWVGEPDKVLPVHHLVRHEEINKFLGIAGVSRQKGIDSEVF